MLVSPHENVSRSLVDLSFQTMFRKNENNIKNFPTRNFFTPTCSGRIRTFDLQIVNFRRLTSECFGDLVKLTVFNGLILIGFSQFFSCSSCPPQKNIAHFKGVKNDPKNNVLLSQRLSLTRGMMVPLQKHFGK